MKKNVSIDKRKTFRHGDLRNALVTAGLGMARAGGPSAVILREATRQAGVTPNAAYRHFANQADLFQAVRSACISALAVAIERELGKVRRNKDAAVYARRSLSAVGTAYLSFALGEPGMFRTAFSVPPPVFEPTNPADAGSSGLNPYELLGVALDRMVAAGVLTPANRPGAEFLAWSAVHGLSLLSLDGPLAGLPKNQTEALGKRLLRMVESGLT
jgi:AcrR family transcriptional regulator